MMRNMLFLFFLVVLWSSCTEKERVPAPAPPAIGIISITPDSILQFQDSAFVTIQYEDVNGDVGSSDPDAKDLEVKDSRLAQPDLYSIQPLTPDAIELFIHGQIKIKLPTLFILGNGDYETVTFSIRLRDQSGEWSQTVTTDPIVIKRQ
ncbi:MAG TPA: hypothetical protein PL185_04740 [Flavobacteriales bacterium]|nr:hypothetical protein [Flavobacteriales bacterium]HPH81852.1 hypothetical protein [Flavobacteriales bacterium]